MDIHIEQGGEGDDLLLMLHGMGATGAVWSPMCELAESGKTPLRRRWLVMDLPGHGESGRQESYAIGQYAASVARATLPHLRPQGRLVVLGHSLGGVIALTLATGWFGITPQQVFGLGIKVAWTDEELARMTMLASQEAKQFATQDEAMQRYLKVSGLAGIVDAKSPVAKRGVHQEQGADVWRLAMDPRAHGVGKPPMSELMQLAQCPVQLARGRDDPMMSLAQLKALDPHASEIEGVGHNAMVQAPQRVWDWLAACAFRPAQAGLT